MAADYSLENLHERVKESCRRLRPYLDQRLLLFRQMQEGRKQRRVKVVAWCGYGQAGKDTSAMMFAKMTNTKYSGSCSMAVLPIIADSVGLTETQAFMERHANRVFWFNWCNALRDNDPTLLVKLSLGNGDCVSGIRDHRELFAAQEEGLIDLSIWVERNVPVDPTTTYTKDDCDLVVMNNGSEEDLRKHLQHLANCFLV